jgi:hypothetical protein
MWAGWGGYSLAGLYNLATTICVETISDSDISLRI